MSGAGVVYQPHADATPEGELRILVDSYPCIILESDASKEAVRPGGRGHHHVCQQEQEADMT
jgi:hypothetical protein